MVFRSIVKSLSKLPPSSQISLITCAWLRIVEMVQSSSWTCIHVSPDASISFDEELISTSRTRRFFTTAMTVTTAMIITTAPVVMPTMRSVWVESRSVSPRLIKSGGGDCDSVAVGVFVGTGNVADDANAPDAVNTPELVKCNVGVNGEDPENTLEGVNVDDLVNSADAESADDCVNCFDPVNADDPVNLEDAESADDCRNCFDPANADDPVNWFDPVNADDPVNLLDALNADDTVK